MPEFRFGRMALPTRLICPAGGSFMVGHRERQARDRPALPPYDPRILRKKEAPSPSAGASNSARLRAAGSGPPKPCSRHHFAPIGLCAVIIVDSVVVFFVPIGFDVSVVSRRALELLLIEVDDVAALVRIVLQQRPR
jgi:hypothetical protein